MNDMLTVYALLAILAVLVSGIWIGKWLGKATTITPTQQAEDLTKYSQAMMDTKVTETTARAIERVKQGGLSEAAVRLMIRTLEQAQSDETPELKFTGRGQVSRTKRETK